MNVYMTIFSHQLTDTDFLEDGDEADMNAQATFASGQVPPQWYVLEMLLEQYDLQEFSFCFCDQ